MNANIVTADLLPVETAAPRLGKSCFTVRKWCRDHTIAAAKMGKTWGIHPDEIERLNRDGTAPKPGPKPRVKRRAR